jgi:hypothetical protein
MIYDVDYFINKFEAIPEEKWITLAFGSAGAHCALGHCGCDEDENGTRLHTIESAALENLFLQNVKVSVMNVNDYTGPDFRLYQQPTPKQRILAALYDIKKMQSKDIDTGGKKERIVYVSVPVSITEQAKELITS